MNSNDTNAKTVDTNHRPSPAKASSIALIVLQCLHLRGSRDLLAVADDMAGYVSPWIVDVHLRPSSARYGVSCDII